MSDENKIRDAADAVKGIVEAVPVYPDLLQPAVREIGKGLETVAKTIHIVLAPVGALVWGYDQIRDFVTTRVAEKLKDVPADRIKTPSPSVAGPALEALRYTGHEESLREMYAALLATSMNADIRQFAHPSFVEMIKSMLPDEAKILNFLANHPRVPIVDVSFSSPKVDTSFLLKRNFSTLGEEAKCEHSELATLYVDNLLRMGLVYIPEGSSMPSELYQSIETHQFIVELRARYINETDIQVVLTKKRIELTDLGKQFAAACVLCKPFEDFGETDFAEVMRITRSRLDRDHKQFADRLVKRWADRAAKEGMSLSQFLKSTPREEISRIVKEEGKNSD